jgi:hypothetical protein
MSLKSLHARLDKIPDPDLSRLRQQQIYEKLKPLPYEEREELRQELKKQRQQAQHHDPQVPAVEGAASTAPEIQRRAPSPRPSPPRSTETSRPKPPR